MNILKYAAVLAAVGLLSSPAFAQDRAKAEPGGPAGKWSTRTPVTPDPSKIKVPPGYKVGVFAAGLDTITSITVDKADNVWVAISGNTFGFPPEGIDKPHVKIFNKSGKIIRDNVGLGIFKSFALNEIGYCHENGRTYVGDYSYGIWEIDGVNGTPKLIMNEVPIGDHALGGITCRDGWLYYAEVRRPIRASPIRIFMAGPMRLILTGKSARPRAYRPCRVIRPAATSR